MSLREFTAMVTKILRTFGVYKDYRSEIARIYVSTKVSPQVAAFLLLREREKMNIKYRTYADVVGINPNTLRKSYLSLLKRGGILIEYKSSYR